MKCRKDTIIRMRLVLANLSIEYMNDLDQAEKERDNNVSAIHEHTPTLLTEERIKDLNFNLSMAGVKCGFSEGVFVLDGQNGVVTAT